MALRLHFADLTDFDVMRAVTVGKHAQLTPGEPLVRTHARGGAIAMRGMALPGMMAAFLDWKLEEDVLIEDATNSSDINILFQTGGHMHTRFRGLAHKLDMQAGRHNLVFTPEAGEQHRMAAAAPLALLHLSIDRAHFKNMIGTEGAWAEQLLRALDDGRPFSGMPGTGSITPAMHGLLAGIRSPATGPMQHLLLQSRITELLALQLGQFTTHLASSQPTGGLSPDEVFRLHELKAHLDQHFLADHSLPGLARHALLNEFKLKKGFKQLFGTTVFGYLRDRRMAHADHLLRDCALLVEEVSDRLGYEHPHHFAAAFKKHFGCRPSERR